MRYGAITISMTIFELRETLTGQYGKDNNLIFDLADQGDYSQRGISGECL
jgi:histidyl-tRNA synthetase